MIYLDMGKPMFCGDCPCYDEEMYSCNAARYIESITDRQCSERLHWHSKPPEWCPLKEAEDDLP